MKQRGGRPGFAVIVAESHGQPFTLGLRGWIGEQQPIGTVATLRRVPQEAPLADRFNEGLVEPKFAPRNAAVSAKRHGPHLVFVQLLAVSSPVVPHIHHQGTVTQFHDLALVGVLIDGPTELPGLAMVVAEKNVREHDPLAVDLLAVVAGNHQSIFVLASRQLDPHPQGRWHTSPNQIP